MAQPKGSNGLSMRGQLELALNDVDDGAAQLAAAIHETRGVLRRLETAYLHSARGYRRIVNVNDGPQTAIPERFERVLAVA